MHLGATSTRRLYGNTHGCTPVLSMINISPIVARCCIQAAAAPLERVNLKTRWQILKQTCMCVSFFMYFLHDFQWLSQYSFTSIERSCCNIWKRWRTIIKCYVLALNCGSSVGHVLCNSHWIFNYKMCNFKWIPNKKTKAFYNV